VAGKPASGKSTVIGLLKAKLEEVNIKVRVIDDYSVLREICPEAKVGEGYYYERGNLVLESEKRAEIMERQYEELRNRWQEQFDGVVFLELAHPRLAEMVGGYFEAKSGDLGILVSVQKEMALKRNCLKPKWRQIPVEFVEAFGDDDEDQMVSWRRGGWEVLPVDNNGTLGLLKLTVEELFLRRFGGDVFVVET